MICDNCIHQCVCNGVRQIEEQQKEYLVKIGMAEPCEFFMDRLKKEQEEGCEYCNKYNGKDCSGSDNMFYDNAANKWYLIAEHYRGEIISIEAEYCLKCGRELKAGEVL
jgi:hypothetical protein